MFNMAKFATLAAVAALTVTAGLTAATPDAEAARRHAHASTCKAPLRGSATGQGLFGKGTAQARAAARYDWESKASVAYGDAYGNFDKSRGKSFDCKRGAVLKAKCTVVSRPCK
ncbi:MAG: hypothetical protein HOP09_00300 [Hyphomicrobium sp.]|nr:hypothetical protein [Hyphomicrobium sp.]